MAIARLYEHMLQDMLQVYMNPSFRENVDYQKRIGKFMRRQEDIEKKSTPKPE
jgi:hypothetical protein